MENKKIIDYCIIESMVNDKLNMRIENFELKVRNKIREGFVPLGGVSTFQQSTMMSISTYYTQALVKYEGS